MEPFISILCCSLYRIGSLIVGFILPITWLFEALLGDHLSQSKIVWLANRFGAIDSDDDLRIMLIAHATIAGDSVREAVSIE